MTKRVFVQNISPNQETGSVKNHDDSTTDEKTIEEWIASAPEHLREHLSESWMVHNQKIDRLVEQILDDDRNTFTENELRALPVHQLEGVAAFVNNPGHSDDIFDDDDDMTLPLHNGNRLSEAFSKSRRPNYQGAQGAPRSRMQADDDIHLDLPVYDWSRRGRRN